MSELWKLGFRGKDLESLNTVRKFLNLLHLSDLTACDGSTIDQSVYLETAVKSQKRIFPRENPTSSDFKLWKDAIGSLTSGEGRITPPLGDYVVEPHLAMDWAVSEDKSVLHRKRDHFTEEMHDVFEPLGAGVRIRHGTRYVWTKSEQGVSGLTHYASVTHEGEDIVKLHSTCRKLVTTEPGGSFKEVLRSFKNQSLWSCLDYDGNGEWIHRGLLMGSLCTVHDGSYMKELSERVCSAAVVIYCKVSKKRLKCAVAEETDQADNYRGEILGGVLDQLLLRAATARRSSPYKEVVVHCDNRGVLTHGNDPYKKLKENNHRPTPFRH